LQVHDLAQDRGQLPGHLGLLIGRRFTILNDAGLQFLQHGKLLQQLALKVDVLQAACRQITVDLLLQIKQFSHRHVTQRIVDRLPLKSWRGPFTHQFIHPASFAALSTITVLKLLNIYCV